MQITDVYHPFDARSRLVGTTSTSSLTYTYDPAGNRVAVTNGTNVTRWVVNPNAALSQALIRVKNGVTNYYVYGLGLLYEVTETATSTNTLTYHYDYRGSTVALTDGIGTVKERFEYSAYGCLTYRSGTNDIPFMFNGRYGVQTDANGLLYMRARYYNPYICRFINPDPVGFSGGLNSYAYADGNPVSLIDPFGLRAESWDTGYGWLDGGLNLLDQIIDSTASTVHSVGSSAIHAGVEALANFDPTYGGGNEPTGREVNILLLWLGLREVPTAKTATEINPNKFNYLFGNVAPDAHNTARSLQNAAQLNRIGIQNTTKGVQILTEHLNSAAQGSGNIINTFSKTLPDGSLINLQTRGSLLSGPGGFLKLESTWQVMPDGTLRFTTAIPIGGH